MDSIEEAAAHGFTLHESYVAGRDVWVWRRGDDYRHA
jgi:hypothetical protein